jgi:aminocarboxymuconate-semialdehyde decarboxylase
VIVNWHSHIQAPGHDDLESLRGGAWRARIENLLEVNARAGVDLAVVTDPLPYAVGVSDREALEFSQRWNAYASEMQAKHHDSTVFFATSFPCGGKTHLDELERAIVDYGLHGVVITSNHNGMYPDVESATPFFELVSALDVPIFFHAPLCKLGGAEVADNRLQSSLARPFDECVSLSRMILAGVFERFPQLKLVASHLGGGISEYIGRLDYAYELGDEASFLGPYEKRTPLKPSAYLSRISVDSACYYAPALKCAIESFGVSNVVHGADAPILDSLLPASIRLVQNLPLPPSDIEAILSGNALRLLKLNTVP